MSEADRGIDGPRVRQGSRPAPRITSDLDAVASLGSDTDDRAWLRLPRGIAVAAVLAVPFWALIAWWLLG